MPGRKRKYLLIPLLTRYAITAPRDQRRAWDRYWSSVRRTGAGGEVLWDAEQPAEMEGVLARFRAHADRSLPAVDLGCGNGRQARALTQVASRVIGVDRSPAAVERAGVEEPDVGRAHAEAPDVEFRVADITDPAFGPALHAELGDVNVHVRGVLHVVDADRRPAVIANLAALAGTRGTVFVCETDVAGDPLDYLLRQGATPTRLPPVMRRLIAAGVRAPSHFGAEQVAEHFPPPWRVVDAGPAVMYGVPLQPGGPVQEIPGYQAVLRMERDGNGLARLS
jgi:SAM-dependent methyltransferase